MRLLLSQGAAGLLLDPGLGKTSISLAAIQVLLAEKAIRSALVIAPLRVVYEVWPAEAEKWTTFRGLRLAVLHGPQKDARLRQPADIYLVNPEGLAWLRRAATAARWRWPELLIVDESTKFKNTRAQRSRLLRELLPRFRRRYILTGTPVPNGLLDLFGQIYILDLGASLGRWFTRYRQTYFTPTGFGGYTWVPASDEAVEQIYERVRPLVLRLSAEEFLTLPEKVETTIYATLPSKARRAYQQLERELLLRVEAGEVTAGSAGVATMKLRQLASGAVYLDEDGAERRGERRYLETHAEKLDALADLVEELSGQPLLVAYEFQHDLARLRALFGAETPAIEGGIPPARLREIVAAWNAGRLPLLFAQPASAAWGLNLQGACAHLAWFNLPWNLEHFDQLTRRIWRQGQRSRKVFVYYLVARATIDETVRDVLAAKNASQTALFAALTKRRAR